MRAMQIARTEYLVTDSLIPDATIQSLAWTAGYPSTAIAFGAATFAASG